MYDILWWLKEKRKDRKREREGVRERGEGQRERNRRRGECVCVCMKVRDNPGDVSECERKREGERGREEKRETEIGRNYVSTSMYVPCVLKFCNDVNSPKLEDTFNTTKMLLHTTIIPINCRIEK